MRSWPPKLWGARGCMHPHLAPKDGCTLKECVIRLFLCLPLLCDCDIVTVTQA